MSFFVVGAIFGDAAVSLFAAGAAFGEIWVDSRGAKCCIFQSKMHCGRGKGSANGRVQFCNFMFGSCLCDASCELCAKRSLLFPGRRNIW